MGHSKTASLMEPLFLPAGLNQVELRAWLEGVKDQELAWTADLIEFMEHWLKGDEIPTYTSGSTGAPKSIELKKASMIRSAERTLSFLGIEGGKALLNLPASKIGGRMMIVRALQGNLELDILPPTENCPKGKSYALGAMTPYQLARQHKTGEVPGIRHVLVGGSALDRDLARAVMAWPVEIYETYGMTETASHVALKKLGDDFFRCLEGIEISTDETGRLHIQVDGQIFITNDTVEHMDEGQFRYQGRLDNAINSGGIKYFPEELEAELGSVLEGDFFIHGEEDPELGQRIVIVATDRKDQRVDLSEVLDRYAIPKRWYFVGQLRRTENGKLDREATYLEAKGLNPSGS
jgi:O-succinylbenzoic acid--CoA ligase